METAGKQSLRNDKMSDCRSFGSNYYPCSQSRKISIGIVVDKSDKTRSNNVREGVAGLQTKGNLTSSKASVVDDDASKKDQARDPKKRQHVGDPEKETSPWVSSKSARQNIQSMVAVDKVKQASSLPSSTSAELKQRKRSNDANGSEGLRFVQFNDNQKSVLQPDDEQQKKFSRVLWRNEGRDTSSAGVKEFSFPTAQEVIDPDKEVAEDKTNNTESKGSETLRMKLWEVLGAVSSPVKQSSNSQSVKSGTHNLESDLKTNVEADTISKPRQNSDTIESDSDSPNTKRRPVTHSSTRKRPKKVQLNKLKSTPPSRSKQKHPEKKIFTSSGGSKRISACGNPGSSGSNRKKSQRESSRTEPLKFCIPEWNDADEAHQTAYRSKTKPPAEKSSLFRNRLSRFNNLPSTESKDSHKSADKEKTDKLDNHEEPVLQKNMDQQEDGVNPSLKDILDPQDDFQSPIMEFKDSKKTSSLGSSPENDLGEQQVHSPAVTVLNMEGILSFKSFLTKSPAPDKKNEETETSDDEGEHDESPVTKSVPVTNKNLRESTPSKSISEENDSESLGEEGSPTEGPSEAEMLSPYVDTAQKSEFVFHPTKRRHINESVEFTRFSPTPASAKGSEEIKGFPSELNQENGLASAVVLFAKILERIKSRMQSTTSKRSAEILKSVATEIHLQLQNAESQIQTDVGKLTTVSKSKRKRLETRFQEQQDQLKVIYERFKDEVNTHLQDCRSTLGGLEAHQIEFKGTVEKQKASHKKLLLQAEETIEAQLCDAERRITAVHKSARDKMLQLKYVIAEFLNEDTLC